MQALCARDQLIHDVSADAIHRSLLLSLEKVQSSCISRVSLASCALDMALLRALGPCFHDKYDSTPEKLKDALAAIKMVTAEAAASAEAASDAGTMKCVGQLCERALMEARIPGSDCLTHKARLAHLADALFVCGVRLTPKTFLVQSLADAVEVMAVEASCQLWYLKQPHLQRGQGIFLISSAAECAKFFAPDNLTKTDDKKAMVLQKSVHPPSLIGGRKFGLRVHLLIVFPPLHFMPGLDHNRHFVAWVHSDAVLTICGSPYDVECKDLLTHIVSGSFLNLHIVFRSSLTLTWS